MIRVKFNELTEEGNTGDLMKSRTKVEINETTISKLFEKAGIPNAENIAPLGAGEFNAVYSVDANGKHYAIKIAPLVDEKILTYEHSMIEQEVYYYGKMKQAGIHVPEIYASDFSKTDISTEYFIMERLTGQQTDQAGLTNEQWKTVNTKLAEMVAQMHSIKGEEYGYRQNGLHKNWYQALQSMVTNLIKDGEKLNHRSSRGKKLMDYINRNQAILKQVKCSLINFDIWPQNIICDTIDGELHLSWIDPERCLWGDRISDFVCLDFMKMNLDEKTAIIETYNQTADEPIMIDDEERIRFAIMLGYLGLIMEVEKYARYNLFMIGWWRNVLVSGMLFKNCFTQLEALTK